MYLSNNLTSIPDKEKWNLVVGNPPHFSSSPTQLIDKPEIIYMDRNWELHKRFYCEIEKFLASNGSIILQENAFCSSRVDFMKVIETNGFKILGEFPCEMADKYYYLWSKRASDS